MTSPAIPRPLTPPRRLPWRVRFACVAAIIAVGVGISFAVTHEWGTTPGPLGSSFGESLAIPREVGQTWMFGRAVALNNGDQPAVLRRIALVSPSPGLRVLDTRVAGPERTYNSVSTASQWPDAKLRDVRPVAGAVVAPASETAGRRGVELLFVLRSDKPGRYGSPGVVIDYTVGGKQHRRYLSFAIGVCVHAVGGPANRNCQPPQTRTADELRDLDQR